jgi:hypothetical protein
MEVDLDSTTQGTFFIPSKRRRRQEAEPSPAEEAAPKLSAWTQAAFDKSWAKHQARIAVRPALDVISVPQCCC